MNRIFMLFFCVLLVISIITFLAKRKSMPPKQQGIIFALYGLTIGLLVCLQLQYNQILPFGHLSTYIAPLKNWIERWM
ncbi:hypothetical protein [uncultured Brevibacillus sp.]|uniref:hypothetical protein n=1 Tax=uncultured Brevibacillus sp. TaxID=169970 RepID=UPI0025931C2E|nr:hypothetical protein [uncultured Brevibacillus sp.]